MNNLQLSLYKPPLFRSFELQVADDLIKKVYAQVLEGTSDTVTFQKTVTNLLSSTVHAGQETRPLFNKSLCMALQIHAWDLVLLLIESKKDVQISQGNLIQILWHAIEADSLEVALAVHNLFSSQLRTRDLVRAQSFIEERSERLPYMIKASPLKKKRIHVSWGESV